MDFVPCEGAAEDPSAGLLPVLLAAILASLLLGGVSALTRPPVPTRVAAPGSIHAAAPAGTGSDVHQ